MNSYERPQSDIDAGTIAFAEAAQQLRAEPYLVRQWSQRFSEYLSINVNGEYPRYSSSDIITLSIIQTLIGQGQTDAHIFQHLSGRGPGNSGPGNSATAAGGSAPSPSPATAGRPQEPNAYVPPSASPPLNARQSVGRQTQPLPGNDPAGNTDADFSVTQFNESGLPAPLTDVFSTLASNQRAVLNNQATVREIVGVIVQDNFNLKDENRKLRDRMLEMERALAEYQRREELRKERLESRLRALEGTVGALQQQIAQIVQVIRKKRRSWFG